MFKELVDYFKALGYSQDHAERSAKAEMERITIL